MKRKHYIILMVTFVFVIVACVFLSQTIQSVASPKAEFIKPRKENVSTEYVLSGRFALPDLEDQYLDPDQSGPVTITNILGTPGLEVKKGQLLFEAEVSDEVLEQRGILEERLDQLMHRKATQYKSLIEADVDLDSPAVRLVSDYSELNKSLLFMEEGSPEYKDAKRKLSSMEAQMKELFSPGVSSEYQLVFQWYNLQNEIKAMVDEIKEHPSQRETLEDQLDVLLQQKITVYDTLMEEEVDLNSPAVQLIFNYLEAERTLLTLNQKNPNYAMIQERKTALEAQIHELLAEDQDDAYDLIFSWYDLLDDIDGAVEDLGEYDAMIESLSACVAPYDGIIIDVNAKMDKIYTGDQPLYTISAAGELGVAADVTRNDPSVYNRTHLFQCEYQGRYYSCAYGSVKEDEDTGTKTLYIMPKDSVIDENDSSIHYLNEAVTVYSDTVPIPCDYALPSGAVFEDGDDTYVYIARKEKDFWGEQYKARLTEVDIVAEGSKYTGVGWLYLESGEYVLNNWNKNIEDGERVMEYGE